MNMTKYSVYCLRYFPDLVSGEFVNVGVSLVTHDGWWSVRVAEELKDLSCIFPTAQPRTLQTILKQLAARVNNVHPLTVMIDPATPNDPLAGLRRYAGNLIGSIRWSDIIIEGVTSDLEAELTHWFSELVPIAKLNTDNSDAVSKSPKQAQLKRVMEREFVRRGIRHRLKSAHIEGYYNTRFEYAYENGLLNVFEPVRLSYKRGSTIVDHAHRWRGKLDVVGEQLNKPLAFYALVDVPREASLQSDLDSALAIIRRANIDHVETIPATDIDRFGQLVAEVVSD